MNELIEKFLFCCVPEEKLPDCKEMEFRKRIQFMQGGKLRRIKFKYKGKSLEAVLDKLPTAEILREEEDGVVR